MRKNINTETIVGRVYQHSLEVKTVKNEASANFGKEYIAGTIDIAIDETGLNVIPVHYSYVTPQTSKGYSNKTYTALSQIIENGKTWIKDGKDAATIVKASPALALNEFYSNGELVSVKQNEGGFIDILASMDNEKVKNKFKVDILITKITEKEADEERGYPAYVVVKGAIFDFRNKLLPMEFSVRTKDGMDFFLSQIEASASEPYYTCIWGEINCSTQIVTKTEESAFGEAAVTTYERKSKDWTITGMLTEPYDFGAEDVMTVEEVKNAMQVREVDLAELKKRAEENAIKKAPAAAKTSAPVQAGEFQF